MPTPAKRGTPAAALPPGSRLIWSKRYGDVPTLPALPTRALLVMRFSAASTTPSLASTPTHEPALEMASMAYLRSSDRHKD